MSYRKLFYEALFCNYYTEELHFWFIIYTEKLFIKLQIWKLNTDINMVNLKVDRSKFLKDITLFNKLKYDMTFQLYAVSQTKLFLYNSSNFWVYLLIINKILFFYLFILRSYSACLHFYIFSNFRNFLKLIS